MLANTTTPDGCTVNADGAWTENGVVQTHGTNSNLDDVALAGDTNINAASGVVMDGKSWPQITFDETLLKAHQVNGLNLLTVRLVILVLLADFSITSQIREWS